MIPTKSCAPLDLPSRGLPRALTVVVGALFLLTACPSNPPSSPGEQRAISVKDLSEVPVVAIPESAFRAALSESGYRGASEIAKKSARRIAARANEPGVRRLILKDRSDRQRFAGEVFLVVSDDASSRQETSSFYTAAVRLEGMSP